MNDETKGWVTVDMTDDHLSQIDPDLTRRIAERNPGKIIMSPGDVRSRANADGRWDTWGGDGVGP